MVTGATVTAEYLVKFAARRVEKMFKKQRRIIWMYHFVCEDGRQGIFTPPPFLESKDLVVAAARALFEAEDVIAYVFINEVWQVRDKEMQTREQADALLDKYGSLQHVPGRTETVMMMGEDANGMVFGSMPINRPEGRAPYLGKLEIIRPDNMEGRMVGLLPQRGTRQ